MERETGDLLAEWRRYAGWFHVDEVSWKIPAAGFDGCMVEIRRGQWHLRWTMPLPPSREDAVSRALWILRGGEHAKSVYERQALKRFDVFNGVREEATR